MVHDISVEHVFRVAQVSPGEDPFQALRDVLYAETYGRHSSSLKACAKAFTGLVALNLLLTISLLVMRFARGDRKFYRIYRSPRGRFIVPNVLQTWLAFNAIFLVLCFPFTWLAVLQESGSRRNEPLWICLVYIPMFAAVWHTAWGTSIASFLQSARLSARQSLWHRLPPFFVNAFFLGILFLAIGAMSGVTGSACVRYNKGIDAYEFLDAKLKDWLETHGSASGTAADVVEAIPEATELLHEMAMSFNRFEIPFGVCMTFALLAAAVMLIACAFQVKLLNSQIGYIRISQHDEAVETGSSGATLLSNAERKRGVQRVLRTIIATSLALLLSMGVYASVCVVGRRHGNWTPVFERYKDGEAHLYVILFAYTGLELLILILIAIQTWDKGKAAGTTHAGVKETIKPKESSIPDSTADLVYEDLRHLPFSTAAYDPRLSSAYSTLTSASTDKLRFDTEPLKAGPYSTYSSLKLQPVSDFAPRGPVPSVATPVANTLIPSPQTGSPVSTATRPPQTPLEQFGHQALNSVQLPAMTPDSIPAYPARSA